MATNFLKNRHADFVEELIGSETVEYFAFDDATADDRFSEVNEASAYDSTGIKISAIIDHNPSQAMRAKFGLDLNFNAIIEIIKKHAVEKNINPKIGDKIKVPPDQDFFYIVKIQPGMQVEDGEFLNYVLAVEHKVGRR